MIGAAYWPENKLDFPRIAALVNARFRSEIEANKDELGSLCDDMRAKLQNNSKFVVRAAIENLQRCVLLGLPPTAIAQTRETEVLARWAKFAGKRLNGYLAEEVNRPDKFAGTMAEFEDSSEASEDLREIDEICFVVQEIHGKGPSQAILSMFFELAIQAPFESWSSAFIQMKSLALPQEFYRRITKGMKFCRAESGTQNWRALPVSEQEKFALILGCR